MNHEWKRIGKFVAETHVPKLNAVIRYKLQSVKDDAVTPQPKYFPKVYDEYNHTIATIYPNVTEVQYKMASENHDFGENITINAGSGFLTRKFYTRVYGEPIAENTDLITFTEKVINFYNQYKNLPDGKL